LQHYSIEALAGKVTLLSLPAQPRMRLAYSSDEQSWERTVARNRKADPRSSRTRRKRRIRMQKSERLVAVPLQYRAAFANYLLHGLSPAEARLRVCADMAETQEH
jgi:hypothetical protein